MALKEDADEVIAGIVLLDRPGIRDDAEKHQSLVLLLRYFWQEAHLDQNSAVSGAEAAGLWSI